MFTGIIEAICRVQRVAAAAESSRVRIDLGALVEGTQLGDSIAVDGACLTVARLDGSFGEFDVSAETLRRTTLGSLRAGNEVNLERSLRLGDRIGGHFVQGHVDEAGTVRRLQQLPGQTTLEVEASPAFIGQLIMKGSVTVDGISLTIAGLTDNTFSIAVIPHTLDNTTLRRKSAGDRVNLETDVIGKYVARYLAGLQSKSGASGGLSEAFLAEHGFR